MPGLLRGIARTAVVAGTATAVSGRVARRQQGRWAAQEQAAQQQAAQQQAAYVQQAPAPPPQYAAAAVPTDTSEMLDQLQQLGQLRDAGVLTDAEFQEQKNRILGS